FPKVRKVQDIHHPSYDRMRLTIDSILSQKKYPIIYASGHDHALEYFRKAQIRYIVSGAGSKSNQFNKARNQDFDPTATASPENLIALVREGFFVVDYIGAQECISLYYEENNLVTESID